MIMYKMLGGALLGTTALVGVAELAEGPVGALVEQAPWAAALIVMAAMFLRYGERFVSALQTALDRNTTAVSELRVELAEMRRVRNGGG